MLNPWLALTFKAMQLGFDAQNVIALRMMRLAAGGARGQKEVCLMVSEKIAQALKLKLRRFRGSSQRHGRCRPTGAREQTPIIS